MLAMRQALVKLVALASRSGTCASGANTDNTMSNNAISAASGADRTNVICSFCSSSRATSTGSANGSGAGRARGPSSTNGTGHWHRYSTNTVHACLPSRVKQPFWQDGNASIRGASAKRSNAKLLIALLVLLALLVPLVLLDNPSRRREEEPWQCGRPGRHKQRQ